MEMPLRANKLIYVKTQKQECTYFKIYGRLDRKQDIFNIKLQKFKK